MGFPRQYQARDRPASITRKVLDFGKKPNNFPNLSFQNLLHSDSGARNLVCEIRTWVALAGSLHEDLQF